MRRKVNYPSSGTHLRWINGGPLYYKHSIAKRTHQCSLGKVRICTSSSLSSIRDNEAILYYFL
jgi:hypothetical protein